MWGTDEKPNLSITGVWGEGYLVNPTSQPWISTDKTWLCFNPFSHQIPLTNPRTRYMFHGWQNLRLLLREHAIKFKTEKSCFKLFLNPVTLNYLPHSLSCPLDLQTCSLGPSPFLFCLATSCFYVNFHLREALSPVSLPWLSIRNRNHPPSMSMTIKMAYGLNCALPDSHTKALSPSDCIWR